MLIKDEMLRGAIARALRITEDKITKEEIDTIIRKILWNRVFRRLGICGKSNLFGFMCQCDRGSDTN